jgi:hypothetical protein
LYSKILKIFGALRAKELFLPPDVAKGSEAVRPGDDEHVQPVVSPEVQPGTYRSEVPVGHPGRNRSRILRVLLQENHAFEEYEDDEFDAEADGHQVEAVEPCTVPV